MTLALCLAFVSDQCVSQSNQYCGSKVSHITSIEEQVTHIRTSEFVVPVIFHILYVSEDDNISDDRIYSQLDRINVDYNNQNANLATVPAIFRSQIGNPEITFCLATTDPSGQPSSGINRIQTRVETIGNSVSVDGRPRIKYTSLGGQDAWDTDKYLNVWVGSRAIFLGESTFPNEEPTVEQGIIIDPRYIGANDDQQFGLGRVLTHEIGHYLGLFHLWGLETGCNNDDGVDDTPMQDEPYFGCQPFPQVSCGSADMTMNFMNTMDDDCMSFFTQAQVDIMHRVLQTSRQALVNQSCRVQENVPDLSMIPIRNLGGIYVLEFGLNQIQMLDIQLFDLQGRLISEHRIGPRFIYEIDTKSFTDGVYILRLATEDSESTKLVYIHN